MYRNVILSAALACAMSPALAADLAQDRPPDRTTSAWAAVGIGGNIEYSTNVSGSRRIARGQYEIDFPEPVGACYYNATIAGGKTSGKVEPGLIVVQHQFGTPRAVFVSTFSPVTLVPTNYPFHLAVACP